MKTGGIRRRQVAINLNDAFSKVVVNSEHVVTKHDYLHMFLFFFEENKVVVASLVFMLKVLNDKKIKQ